MWYSYQNVIIYHRTTAGTRRWLIRESWITAARHHHQHHNHIYFLVSSSSSSSSSSSLFGVLFWIPLIFCWITSLFVHHCYVNGTYLISFVCARARFELPKTVPWTWCFSVMQMSVGWQVVFSWDARLICVWHTNALSTGATLPCSYPISDLANVLEYGSPLRCLCSFGWLVNSHPSRYTNSVVLLYTYCILFFIYIWLYLKQIIFKKWTRSIWYSFWNQMCLCVSSMVNKWLTRALS